MCLLGSAFFDLDNVVVPAENILGKENNGFEIIMSSEYIDFVPEYRPVQLKSSMLKFPLYSFHP